MKMKDVTRKSFNILWQMEAWIFFWFFLLTILLGLTIYIIICVYLQIFPFTLWSEMEARQHTMIISIAACMPVYAILLTFVVTYIYKKNVYLPLKSLLSDVDKASGFEGRNDHSEIYQKTDNKNQFDLNNPSNLWTDRVKEYIDSVTKEQYFDDMTGCFNRKYFSQAITDVLKTQMMCSLTSHKNIVFNADTYYGIYLVDIDHFKTINDDFGHYYGDLVLGQVGRTLRSTVGHNGIVIRHGGEEFLIIVCLSYPMKFSALAEKLRSEFSQNISVANPQTQEIRYLTCSIGFLPFPLFKDDVTALSVEQHVNLSDQAMYMAKTCGRDTWRGIEVNTTPATQAEFEKAAMSMEYGTHIGYFNILKPDEIITS